MALGGAANRYESRSTIAVSYCQRGAVEVGSALDQLKPIGSLTRNTCESQ